MPEMALEKHHPVAVPGLADDRLGVGRLPALLVAGFSERRHTAAHAVVPVAEGYEERRDDGEEQEAAAGDNGENDGLPEVRISFGSRRRGRRGQRQFHVVAGERGVHEAEEGLGHGSVEMVAGEVRNCSVGRARLLESVGLGRGPWKALKERSSTWRLRNRARAASGRGPTNALRWRWRPVSSGRSGSRLFARRLSPSNAARWQSVRGGTGPERPSAGRWSAMTWEGAR
jgi:hypothetical protein